MGSILGVNVSVGIQVHGYQVQNKTYILDSISSHKPNIMILDSLKIILQGEY